jgi:NADH-quinone oxidoreductase subunit N
MNDHILRLAPVGFPIAGSILGMFFESIVRRPVVAVLFAVLGLLGALITALGGAAGLPGYGSELFGLDGAGASLTAAAALFALFSLAVASNYLKPQEDEFPAELASLLVLVPAGVGLIAGARHFILIFIGIELLSIPLYALVGLRRHRAASIEGALKYFLLGAFAAGFIAYGMSLLFASERTLDLAALAGAAGRSPVAAAGTALVLAGLLFKISAAPFHFWTPDAYEGAATPITALMASCTKIAAVAALLKAMPLLPTSAWPVLGVLSILTIAAGNFGALMQSRVKRILAYSSIAHAGTLLLALAAERAASGTAAAADISRATTQSAVFYLAAYGASALGAFGILAILERGGDRFIDLADFRGLSRRQPLMAWLLAIFLLSLAGIPPTGGFWAKYFVFATAVRAGQVWLAVAGIVLSVLGVAYYLRVISTCFMSPEDEELGAPPQGKTPLAALLATVLAAIGIAAIGFLPSQWIDAIGR